MERVKRYSRKREAILECIRSTKTHPDAEWVYGRLKNEFPDLSLGTVYRNIAQFKQEGLVVTVTTVDGVERIDADTRPHGHMICRLCGDVSDFETDCLNSGCGREGFSVERCDVLLHGVCRRCNKAQ